MPRSGIGAFRERITVQSATVTQDTYGEPDKTWATYCTRWASVEPISGAERLRANIDLAVEVVRFTIRYDEETKLITPAMRISYDGRIYDIDAAANVQTRRRFIEILTHTVDLIT